MRCERVCGAYYRRIDLPDTADSERINASEHDGVLKNTVPKSKKALQNKIKVEH